MRRFIASLLAGLGIAVCSFAPPAAAAAQNVQANNPLAVRAYAGVLHKINPRMPAWQSRDLAHHMLLNANRWKLDANVLVAIVTVESSWHTHAVSRVGALGLGQLMPRTARQLRVDPHDPYQNLQGAARYLHGLLNAYRNKPQRYALAFAAYNAGPKAVARYGGIPPFAETQRYVVKVMAAWQRISSVVRIPKPKNSERARALAAGGAAADVKYWAGTQR